MSAEVPIKHNEIIEENWSDNASESADKLLAKIQSLIVGFKQLAALTGKKYPIVDPKTLSEVEQYEKDIQKLKNTINGLTTAQKAQIQIQEITTKQKREYRAELKAETSAYQQLQNELNKYRQISKDLMAMQAQGTKLTKDQNIQLEQAQLKTTQLDTTLKKIDGTLGVHNRHVGNYTGAIKTLGQGAGGLIGIFATLGRAVGLNTEAIENLHMGSTALVKMTREFTHAMHLEKLAHTENTTAVVTETTAKEVNVAVTEGETIAHEENIVALEEEGVVRTASIGIIGLVAVAVAGLSAGIYYLVTSTDDATYALASLDEGLKNIGNSRSDKFLDAMGEKLDRIGVNILQFKGKIKEAENLLADPNISNESREKAEKDLEEYHKKLDEIQAEQSKTEIDLQIETEKQKNEEAKKGSSEKIKIRLQEIEQLKKTNEKLLDEPMEEVNARQEANNQYVEDVVERNARIDVIGQDLLREQKALEKQLTETEADELEKRNKEAEKKHKENADAYKKHLDELRAIRERFLNDTRNVSDENAEYDRNIREGMAKLTKIKNENEKEIEENEKNSADYKKKLGDEYLKAQHEKEAEEKKLLDAWKKREEEKVEMAKKYSDAIFEGLQQNTEKELKLNDDKIAKLDRQIEYQMEKALDGQQNSYDELEAQRAKALEQKAMLDKKLAKEKEGQQLAEIFLEFLKADIEAGGGKAGFSASAKAMTQTLAAKGLMKLLSGSLFEGQEDIGKANQPLDNKGGRLYMLHDNESVVTGKGTKATKGLVSAINKDGMDGATMWAMKNIFPRVPTISDESKENQVAKAMMSMVYKEMKDLNKNIKDLPDTDFKRNVIGEIVQMDKKMGKIEETTYKNIPGSYRKA